MPHKTRSVVIGLILLGLFAIVAPRISLGNWDLPPVADPWEYGNLLINRTSEKNGMKPVTFSHWIHRQRYTCRVCHFELEFNMKVNTTEITEKTNKAGMHCGSSSCHDGKTAFGHVKPNCVKCHNGNKAYGVEKFAELATQLPKANYGNHIDWTAAKSGGFINPQNYISIKPAEGISFKENLTLNAEWSGVADAVFPHNIHIEWLDCNNCHPDIFNIKKKTTKHFEMVRIISGEFCGVCHLSVAFPIQRCKACHTTMKSEKK